MRKPWFFVSAFALTICLLCGCAGTPQGGAAASPSPAPEASASAPPAPTAMPAPLGQGEYVIQTASIDELVRRYGEYTSYDTAYEAYNGAGMVRLVFEDMTAILSDTQKDRLSFANGDAYFSFGNEEVPLTESDKGITLLVHNLEWTDKRTQGPRGTAIGDTIESIREKFSSKQLSDEGWALYELAEEPSAITLTYYVYSEEGRKEQYLRYLFENGIVVSISQGMGMEGE